jgi:hypothetical protein
VLAVEHRLLPAAVLAFARHRAAILAVAAGPPSPVGAWPRSLDDALQPA